MAEELGKHLAGDKFEFCFAGTEEKQNNQETVRPTKQLYGIDVERIV